MKRTVPWSVRMLTLGCLPMMSVAIGCSSGTDSDILGTRAAHSLHVTTGISQSSDVHGFSYSVVSVDCMGGMPIGAPTVINRDLEPVRIPGGIASLENNPLDKNSSHFFSDLFLTVAPGCYDVTATPVKEDGTPSDKCKAAKKSGIVVHEGQTAEATLIAQCQGDDPGAIDVIAALNHEPELIGVRFEESKFRACGQSQVVCATAIDPDKDPLEFEWTLASGSPAAAGPVVISETTDPSSGAVTQCVKYDPSGPGRYDVRVRVYDHLHAGMSTARIEDSTEEGLESHAEFAFFFYVSGGEIVAPAPAPGPMPGPMAIAPAAAPTLNEVLVLDSSAISGQEVSAIMALGLTPRVIDAATWSTMTTAQFAQYRAIVLGDPYCQVGTAAVSIAEATAPVWAAAVTGNVIVNGTDPAVHPAGGAPLAQSSIAFAVANPAATGAYISLSYYYHDTAPGTPVPVLNGFGSFTVTGVGCHNDAHIVATHPAMSTLNDGILSGWGCSVHEAFDRWPTNFEVLALAQRPDGSYTAGDGSVGFPYILARGVIPVACGDGKIDPGEECDDGNNANGDGCDAACNVERCGDGVLQGGEACDDGNLTGGDGCSAQCTIELCAGL